MNGALVANQNRSQYLDLMEYNNYMYFLFKKGFYHYSFLLLDRSLTIMNLVIDLLHLALSQTIIFEELKGYNKNCLQTTFYSDSEIFKISCCCSFCCRIEMRLRLTMSSVHKMQGQLSYYSSILVHQIPKHEKEDMMAYYCSLITFIHVLPLYLELYAIFFYFIFIFLAQKVVALSDNKHYYLLHFIFHCFFCSFFIYFFQKEGLSLRLSYYQIMKSCWLTIFIFSFLFTILVF